MAYLKKEYRELMKKIDKELKFPRGWYYFVKKEQKKHNFIIKNKGICTCNNCNHQFKTQKKINEYEQCPKCKMTYRIKQGTYTWHIFESDLMLLDILSDGRYVLRLFEIFTRYTKDSMYHSKPAEYGRIVFNKDFKGNTLDFVNDRFNTCMWGYSFVVHSKEGKKWRMFGNDPYRNIETKGKLYHNNIKKLLENTELKYSQLWTLAEKEEDLNIKYLLEYNFSSIELLVKMGLYKLAHCPKTFNIPGNFEKRFGIDKKYYEFMKKNNIDFDELERLRLYQKENIEDIRYLKIFDTSDLKKIMEYMSLEKFVRYTKRKKTFDIKQYLDYLGFAKELKLDLKNKKYLFPDKLKVQHDELEKQMITKKNKKIQNAIRKRSKKLEKNIYKNTKYIIFPAHSISELENESRQQNNCVRTYAEKYAKGNCDIYFLRELKNQKKSLVTVEVRDNKVVQSRTKNNDSTTKSQKMFLDKWEKNVIQKVA